MSCHRDSYSHSRNMGLHLMPVRPLALAIHLLVASGALVFSAHPTNAWAQSGVTRQEARNYAIEAGPLSRVLTSFAQASGIYLVGAGNIAEGKDSPGLQGKYSVTGALDVLLAGTGIQYSRSANTVNLWKGAEASELAPVTVQSHYAPQITEDAETYTAGNSSAATGMDLSIKETPQSVSVLTRKQMDDFGLDTLGDAVMFTPGVTSTGTNPEGSPSMSVRGFEIDNIRVDGVQGSYHAAARGTFHGIMLDTSIYDRVEVVRGATGLTTGSGDPSATVNLVRKRPKDKFGGSVALTAGSWDKYKAVGDITSPLNKSGSIRGRLIAGYNKNRSFQRWIKNENTFASAVVEADLTPSTLLTVGHDYQKDERNSSINGGVPLINSQGGVTDLPRKSWMAPDWTYWDKDYHHTFARVEHEFDNEWQVQLAYGHHRNTGDALIVGSPVRGGAYVQPDGSGIPISVNLVNQSKRSMDNWSFNTQGPFTLFGRSHQLSIGASSTRSKNTSYDMDFDPKDTYYIPDVGNWDGQGLSKPNTWRTGSYSVTHIQEEGGFASVRFSLADPLHLITGVRLSRYKTYTDNYGVDGRFVNQTSYLKNSDVLTPYAGVTYDFTPSTTAYASYTGIFKPQSYRDRNNNFLDPLEGHNIEFGLKNSFFDDTLHLNTAVFKTYQDNVAEIDDSVPPYSLPDGSQAYVSTGKGNKTRGFEVEVNGNLRPNWLLYASYTWTETKDAQGERINLTIPRTIVRLGTHYRLPGQWNRLSLMSNLQWQSSKSLVRVPANVPGVGLVEPYQKGYLIANVGMSYQFNPKTHVSLHVNNVFDKKYYDRTQSWGAYYGAPRNAQLNLRYQF